MTLDRLRIANYRGRSVPVVLGIWLAVVLVGSTAAALWMGDEADPRSPALVILGGSLVVFAAGLIDDLSPGGPRGVRNHLRALASGHVTTGVLKLMVTVASSIVVVAAQPDPGSGARLFGVALIAAGANLWNGLDVAPGRALKAFLVVDGVVLGVPWSLAPGVRALWLAALVSLPFDLRERAMLGDAGANLLGFTAGIGLYLSLPAWGIAVAALVVVGLNVLAETVSLTRLIEASPALRWFDRLGRVPSDGPSTEGRAEGREG
jgi:UDP-N-acetylmuramyl pentapeptide phosphotransferase/UDP-N-acetylglucosamine-1-phosphate transferase